MIKAFSANLTKLPRKENNLLLRFFGKLLNEGKNQPWIVDACCISNFTIAMPVIIRALFAIFNW